MSTPPRTTAQLRADIQEADEAIRQILADRAEEATFEGNQVRRIKLAELRAQRQDLRRQLLQALRRRAKLDPYQVDTIYLRPKMTGDYDPRYRDL